MLETYKEIRTLQLHPTLELFTKIKSYFDNEYDKLEKIIGDFSKFKHVNNADNIRDFMHEHYKEDKKSMKKLE